MDRPGWWFVVVTVVGGALGLGAIGAWTAPADAPDIPHALDGASQGDLYLALSTDVLGQGGLARMAPDCTSVATWRTDDVVDITMDRLNPNAVWVLEEWPESAHGDRRVRHYSTAGALLGWFPVPGSARYIQSETQGYRRVGEIYVLHLPVDDVSARMTVHGEDGSGLRSWDVPGEPRGLGMTFSGAEDRPVYVVVTGQPGQSGTLLRYSYKGDIVWEKPLDVIPVAMSASSGVAVVVGLSPSAPDGPGQVVHVRDDALLLRAWPLEEFVPLDVAAVSPTAKWVLGVPKPIQPDRRLAGLGR